MGANDVLPIGRFSPARGIILDRTDKSTVISGVMELYGPEATAARAKEIETAINTIWTDSFPDGHSVSTRITVTFRGPKTVAGNATQIEALLMDRPSYVGRGTSGRYMTLNARNPVAFSWTAAHEFGHIIGLRDRYIEGMISKISGRFGFTRSTTIEPGYQGNLMGEHRGKLSSQNLADLAAENEPSPYWINDDDYVASWVNTHPASDVAKLSTISKLKAFRTLMGGWVSTDDFNAMLRLCASVSTVSEAEMIRIGVDTWQLNSLGQRIILKLAMSRMPSAPPSRP